LKDYPDLQKREATGADSATEDKSPSPDVSKEPWQNITQEGALKDLMRLREAIERMIVSRGVAHKPLILETSQKKSVRH
jgi:hypothetical protein